MAKNDKPVITVNEGKIRGIKNRSEFSGAEFYSFFGIPYGQSTAGNARFKDPVKAKPWTGVLDGTTEKSGCIQYALQLHRIAGSENCLYNNIHTPMIPKKHDSLKPVIVNIHPGGLFHGSPETFYYGSPEHVMHHEVVFVCIAYRLHVLGFLNLDLKECSGNQAVKDIILALQWVRDNIKSFGGDPDNVTLLGSSTGSLMVHTLMLTPRAKGLFHKAVLMGNYCFNPASVTRKENKKEAIEVASSMGYKNAETENTKELLAFFKQSILTKFFGFRIERVLDQDNAVISLLSPFSLTIEKESENAVITKQLDQYIDSTARIPIIFGICEREAAMGFTLPYKKGTMKKFYSSYRQNSFGWGHHITDEQVEEIKRQVDSFYLKGGSIETASLSQKVDIQTDISFSSVYKTLIDVVSTDLPSSVFVYKFQFDGNVHSMKDLLQPILEEPLEGAYHADDYSYWCRMNDPRLGILQSPNVLTSKTKRIVETFTKLITTFARTGDPNYQGLDVDWRPTTPENPCYLNIDKNLTLIDGKLNGERMEFWEGIIDKYNKP